MKYVLRFPVFLFLIFGGVASAMLPDFCLSRRQEVSAVSKYQALFFNNLEITLLKPEKIYTIVSVKSSQYLKKKTYYRPTRGSIRSAFGYRRRPYKGFHAGIDIAANTGAEISAIDSGVVVFSGWQGTYGRLVIIKHHNGLSSYYSHCHKLFARRGQRISAGAIIATVGQSGNATGPHLHFEIRNNNKAINPTLLVSF